MSLSASSFTCPQSCNLALQALHSFLFFSPCSSPLYSPPSVLTSYSLIHFTLHPQGSILLIHVLLFAFLQICSTLLLSFIPIHPISLFSVCAFGFILIDQTSVDSVLNHMFSLSSTCAFLIRPWSNITDSELFLQEMFVLLKFNSASSDVYSSDFSSCVGLYWWYSFILFIWFLLCTFMHSPSPFLILPISLLHFVFLNLLNLKFLNILFGIFKLNSDT